MSEYYVDNRGKIRGPFSAREIRAFVQTGEIQAETRLRKGREGRWVLATAIDGLVLQLHESNLSPRHASDAQCDECGDVKNLQVFELLAAEVVGKALTSTAHVEGVTTRTVTTTTQRTRFLGPSLAIRGHMCLTCCERCIRAIDAAHHQKASPPVPFSAYLVSMVLLNGLVVVAFSVSEISAAVWLPITIIGAMASIAYLWKARSDCNRDAARYSLDLEKELLRSQQLEIGQIEISKHRHALAIACRQAIAENKRVEKITRPTRSFGRIRIFTPSEFEEYSRELDEWSQKTANGQ